MKLTGSYKIPTDKQSVWEALNNPDILQKCIPGCEEFKKNSDTSFTATATNKIGPFNASFTGDVELQDLNPPTKLKTDINIVSSIIDTSFRANSNITYITNDSDIVLDISRVEL